MLAERFSLVSQDYCQNHAAVIGQVMQLRVQVCIRLVLIHYGFYSNSTVDDVFSQKLKQELVTTEKESS